MARRIEVQQLVDVRRQRRAFDAVEFGDEPDELVRARLDLFACGIQLGAVARRQDDRLAVRQPRRQLAQRRIEPARVEVDPLAQLDGRGLVTDSDEQ